MTRHHRLVPNLIEECPDLGSGFTVWFHGQRCMIQKQKDGGGSSLAVGQLHSCTVGPPSCFFFPFFTATLRACSIQIVGVFNSLSLLTTSVLVYTYQLRY